MTMTLATGTAQHGTRAGIIDCDIHNTPRPKALHRYLPERLSSYHDRFGRSGYAGDF